MSRVPTTNELMQGANRTIAEITAELERVRGERDEFLEDRDSAREQALDFQRSNVDLRTRLAAAEAALEDVVAAQLHRVDDLVRGITGERDALREQVTRLRSGLTEWIDEFKTGRVDWEHGAVDPIIKLRDAALAETAKVPA